jgi:hypothetical protein
MNQFFCAQAARQAQEDLIGSATPHQTFVLIECPPPWAAQALDSQAIPENLRTLVAEVNQMRLPIRFLLVNQRFSTDLQRLRLIIYDRGSAPFVKGFDRWETTVERLEEVAPLVQAYLVGEPLTEGINENSRDILVCVHGSHDKCCARYGRPFYREAIATIEHLGLTQVRLWESSHFGGHRFAPTLIDFPDGRFYGLLDQSSFPTILLRSGEMSDLRRVYRGWSILPTSLQVVERTLMSKYGWHWFNFKVAGQILEESPDRTSIQAKISCESPNGGVYTYAVDLVKDPERSLYLKGSCGDSQPSEFVKYTIKQLKLTQSVEPLSLAS